MRKKLLVLTIFAIFIIWIASLYLRGYEVYAQESTSIDSSVSDESFLRLDLAAADLSKEQAEEIEALKLAFKAETQNIPEKLKKANSEMRTLWESYPPKVEEIVAKQKEIESFRSELQEKVIIYRVKAIEILTEEQFRRIGPLQKMQPPRR